MILAALNDYYTRRSLDPDPRRRLPVFGMESKAIPFIIEISETGGFVTLQDTRERVGTRLIGRSELVPMGIKKTSGVAANLLWDTAEYVLGIDTRGNPDRVDEQHRAFMQVINSLPEAARRDPGVQAVLRFLTGPDRKHIEAESAWADIQESNPLVTFRLHGDGDLVCQRPAVIRAVLETNHVTQSPETCLVTGNVDIPERLHASIKGVWGAQSSGANIVSFNLDAFSSYGKSQGGNAPVGEHAAFAYTTALNSLLARDSGNRAQIGDASTVFWSARPDELELAIPDIFGEPTKDNPDQGVVAVAALYRAIESGRLASADGENRFFVLGLSPNAARIAIRFFHCLPLRDLAVRIQAHFDDIDIAHGPAEAQSLSLFRLLASCAVQGKADNIPPNLGGGLVDAILSGPNAPYPASLLNLAVTRCRAERTVTYPRAAAIKGCLNRQIRQRRQEKEFERMLDPENPNPAYRLGRLFAILERIQEEAAGGPGRLNATIRDRYYGAASSTPVAVFTTLLRLKNAHLRKLSDKHAAWFERQIGEVMQALDDFPNHLALSDQGRFALGYYHQRQHFFTKHEVMPAAPANSDAGDH
ncbi:MAG: type I-C CRISPR-associated protein Cas8c/Csd1 [Burkholderiales bacterium]